MRVEVERRACDFVRELPIKSRRIILTHLRRLEDPLHIPEIERLGTDVYRMHIARTYTVFFLVLLEQDLVRITDIYPIGIAHKRYNRLS
ncbi:hypothetical protein [Methanospirillum lacunae]|uniref:Type II toxin-antitoxin system RelE/ParE family toxin n=1 Tax=Methanospirillum lacunae TaxID=668570 RepID=A0A2V2N9B9_9EURY|nr:hypothetical protein [Methanospirillum lacunae]PWR72181.1 hypothetical protein DK846_09350 [Methanospirillum lacunae]